ncbi:pyridoxal phosphate-dependent aminotransferase [Achromobacter pestifer]|uniref:Pyridoxal phosphate-dependent aminotransferase n=1 Tax=Achromobacter pestifer TaxID=1353889 RepID=A0A7D4E0B5_9BURK|nr:pyridoxal phosphate-dependent aminotransferase [Achromobacter pestifer]QKH35769.1 pyridoxal phosphate-dependent aminotransferase [Achromobacter pestifer]
MNAIEEKFLKLGIDNAPGQEVRESRSSEGLPQEGASLPGIAVDFSHGDVNADAFEPTPGALEAFVQGVHRGGSQAYTEYRGQAAIREKLALDLAAFSGHPVSGAEELIITPGTQSALFLAVASTVTAGDKVAIVQPDYFANRKLVEFMGAEMIPVRLEYLNNTAHAGLDLQQLESAFKAGAKVFLFSNPNNPTGAVYSPSEIGQIAALADKFGATVIVDQLYSRLLYAGQPYVHLRGASEAGDNVVTIMGPSKTESLSGYRLGVAFGNARIIQRMEKLQAIVSLRAPGYCQAVLQTWFSEPAGWLADRIEKHRQIRDDLLALFRGVEGVAVRTPQAGSYLFPRLPKLRTPLQAFVRELRSRASVTVTPGTEFSPHASDSIRLNFSQNHEAAVDAVRRIATVIEEHRLA